MKRVRRRPAESLSLASAVAAVIVGVFGVDDPQVYQALIVIVGSLPAVVTWLVVTIRGR